MNDKTWSAFQEKDYEGSLKVVEKPIKFVIDNFLIGPGKDHEGTVLALLLLYDQIGETNNLLKKLVDKQANYERSI